MPTAGAARRAKPRTQAERTAISDRRMIEAAIRLIVERGTAATTLKRIGEEAGYSRGLVSYRFGSKAALFRAVCRHVSQVWIDELERSVGRSSGLIALIKTVDAHQHFLETSPDALRAMLILWFESIGPNALYKGNVAQVHAVQRREAARWVRAGIRDGSISAEVSAARFAEQYCGSLYGIVYQWLVMPDGVAVRRMYEELKHNVRRLLAH